MKVLRRQGLRIPDEASVIGVHDLDFGELLDPPLTTVRIPLEEMGHWAAKHAAESELLQLSGLEIVFAPTLVTRHAEVLRPRRRGRKAVNRRCRNRLAYFLFMTGPEALFVWNMSSQRRPSGPPSNRPGSPLATSSFTSGTTRTAPVRGATFLAPCSLHGA